MSDTKVIKQDVGMCDGCLSKDRCVASLGKYLEIYRKIWCVFDDRVYEVASLDPLMCWECLTMLHKIYKFYHRVKQAQNILEGLDNKNNLQIEYPCLSNLSMTTIISANEVCNEKDSNSIKEDQTEHSEVIVKFEPDDEKADDAEQKSTVVLKLEFDNNREDWMDFDQDDAKDVVAKHEEAKVKQEFPRKRRKRTQLPNTKYKCVSITRDWSEKHKLYKQVRINNEELLYWLEKERNMMNYTRLAYKCHTCIAGYQNEKRLEKHMKKKHDTASGDCVCDICKVRIRKSRMATHCKEHFKKYVCLLCDHECYKRGQMYYHFTYGHGKALECLECGRRFASRRDFFKHYRDIHEKFICDHCGKKCMQKRILIKHIRMSHTTHMCKECNKTFKEHYDLIRHTNLKHVKCATEDSFCVECNIQFDNELQYKKHIKGNIKHTPRKKTSFTCPECNKVYAKNYTLINHYKHVHLKETSHYCEKCSRYFLNGFRLRQHIASVHDKTPRPKNKICNYCGRGFSNNRILTNHVRTHTGERPFQCDHCPAAFAQKQALVAHTKAIHDKGKNKQRPT